MTTELINKIARVGIYDTRRYRYAYHEHGDRVEIVRLPLELLDTPAAIDGWRRVWSR